MFLFWQDIAPLHFLSASSSEYLALLKIWGISVYKLDFYMWTSPGATNSMGASASLLWTEEAVYALQLHTYKLCTKQVAYIFSKANKTISTSAYDFTGDLKKSSKLIKVIKWSLKSESTQLWFPGF